MSLVHSALHPRSPRTLLGLGLAALLASAFAAPSHALSITPAAFTGTQTVESFEGLVLGPNVGASPFANIVEPGRVSSYTFASGVTLTSPVPNPGTMNNGVFVHDFALPAGASNNWGTNGSVSSALNVPFGTAYIGAFDNLSGATVPVSIGFTFGSDMLRVGAYVTGATGLTLRMDAYSSSGTLLESVTIGTVPVGSWGSNFFGIERVEGIRRVVFSGADFGLDGLTFEGPLVVPEPATGALFGLGVVALGFMRRRSPIGV
jgi:hypothetical protein